MSEKQLDLFDKEREENSWERRQREKAERYSELATKAKEVGQAAVERVRKQRDMIPLGQPILVGHHSEKWDRNNRDKMNRNEEKAWEEVKKGNYYEGKAARIEKNLETNAVISSDDPDAVTKLEAKLAGMERYREKIKEYNKAARAKGEDQTPKYILQNLGGNIRTVKKRIDDLSDEVAANGGAGGIYGAGGVDWPQQSDGFTLADMGAAFTAIVSLVGEPTAEQKSSIIVCRR